MALVKIASNTGVKLGGKIIFQVPTNGFTLNNNQTPETPQNSLKPQASGEVIQFNGLDLQYKNYNLTYINN